jgi:hypothetical protein
VRRPLSALILRLIAAKNPNFFSALVRTQPQQRLSNSTTNPGGRPPCGSPGLVFVFRGAADPSLENSLPFKLATAAAVVDPEPLRPPIQRTPRRRSHTCRGQLPLTSTGTETTPCRLPTASARAPSAATARPADYRYVGRTTVPTKLQVELSHTGPGRERIPRPIAAFSSNSAATASIHPIADASRSSTKATGSQGLCSLGAQLRKN